MLRKMVRDGPHQEKTDQQTGQEIEPPPPLLSLAVPTMKVSQSVLRLVKAIDLDRQSSIVVSTLPQEQRFSIMLW